MLDFPPTTWGISEFALSNMKSLLLLCIIPELQFVGRVRWGFCPLGNRQFLANA